MPQPSVQGREEVELETGLLKDEGLTHPAPRDGSEPMAVPQPSVQELKMGLLKNESLTHPAPGSARAVTQPSVQGREELELKTGLLKDEGLTDLGAGSPLLSFAGPSSAPCLWYQNRVAEGGRPRISPCSLEMISSSPTDLQPYHTQAPCRFSQLCEPRSPGSHRIQASKNWAQPS